jgi:hypothetical protein
MNATLNAAPPTRAAWIPPGGRPVMAVRTPAASMTCVGRRYVPFSIQSSVPTAVQATARPPATTSAPEASRQLLAPVTATSHSYSSAPVVSWRTNSPMAKQSPPDDTSTGSLACGSRGKVHCLYESSQRSASDPNRRICHSPPDIVA